MAAAEEALSNQLKQLNLQTLEKLDPKVRSRIDRLRAIQSHHDDLESKLFHELTSLKSNYHKLSEPFYSRRYDIVNESGVPKFWLTAMKNNKDLANQITARDEGALVYLKDIKCSRIVDEVNQNPKGFRLDFYFDKRNPYFENSVLSKTYEMVYEFPDYKEPLIEKAIGSEINWCSGMCLTKKIKVNKKNGKEKSVDCDSFFDFFKPPQMPESVRDLDEDGAEQLQDDMVNDYDLGCTFRDQIITRAVAFFTGEAAKDDDDDDEDDDSDDDDDEDSDDDEDGEEEEDNDDEDGEDDDDKDSASDEEDDDDDKDLPN
ncbi:Nucleosome assembly protein 1;2 [Linum perenne]